MAVFWVVAPCSPVDLAITLMMEAASTPENLYQATCRNNPEDTYTVRRVSLSPDHKSQCPVFKPLFHCCFNMAATSFGLPNVSSTLQIHEATSGKSQI
jgi:hypothetical protein